MNRCLLDLHTPASLKTRRDRGHANSIYLWLVGLVRPCRWRARLRTGLRAPRRGGRGRLSAWEAAAPASREARAGAARTHPAPRVPLPLREVGVPPGGAPRGSAGSYRCARAGRFAAVLWNSKSRSRMPLDGWSSFPLRCYFLLFETTFDASGCHITIFYLLNQAIFMYHVFQ